MSRSLLLGLLVLALAVVGFVVFKSGAIGDPASGDLLDHADEEDGPTPLPRLHGAEGAVAPPPPGAPGASTSAERAVPRVALGGQVVDPGGFPVPGAIVYLIAKARPEDAKDAPEQMTMTGEEGRFSLAEAALAGRWLGVKAAGYLVAHEDGDALTDTEDLRIVLTTGPEIRVRVEGVDGGPLELPTGLWIQTLDGVGRAYPAPGEDLAIHREFEVAPRVQETRFPVSTEGALTVQAAYHSTAFVVDPEDPVETRGGDALVFRVTPSCVIDLRISDAATGEPLPRGFSYETFHDGRSMGVGSLSAPGGKREDRFGNRPGTYVLRVMATGYLPKETEPVRVSKPGDRATFEVHLERDPTVGSVRISIPGLAELPRQPADGGGTKAAPAFFRWKRPTALGSKYERDTAPHLTWGSLDGEVRRESDTDYLFEGVPEGEVTLVVGEVVSGRVAIVTGIRITGGKTDTTTVDLQKGLYLYPNRLIPKGKTCTSFRIKHPRYGMLPGWSHRPSQSDYYEPGQVPDLKEFLGPYPGPEFEVEVVFDDGTKRTSTVRGD